MSFRAFFAGAAKRDMELKDEARKDALDLAKDTLNYRAEIGMKRRQEKEAKLNNALQLGKNLIDNFSFSPQQVGVLASQGKLGQFHDWYTKAATSDKYKKGGLPTPAELVKIESDKPIDMPFEEYMRKIVIGAPIETKRAELDTSEMNRYQRSAAQAANQYTQQFYKNMGVTETDFNAYALDAFTPMRVQGQVFEEPFKEGKALGDARVPFKDAQKGFAPILTKAMGVEMIQNRLTGEFQGYEGQGVAGTEASMIASEAANRVTEYMRDEQISYGRAFAKVQFELSQPGALQQFYNDAQVSLGIPDPRPMQTAISATASTVGDRGTGANAPMRSSYVLSNDARNNILRSENNTDIGKVIDSSFPGEENKTLRQDLKSLVRTNNQKTPKQMLDVIDNYLGTGRSTTPADPSLNPSENPATRYNKPDAQPEATPEAEPLEKISPRMRKRVQPSKEEQDQAMQEIDAFTKEMVAQGVDVNNPDEVKAALLANKDINIPEEMIDTFANTIARYSAMQSRNQGIA